MKKIYIPIQIDSDGLYEKPAYSNPVPIIKDRCHDIASYAFGGYGWFSGLKQVVPDVWLKELPLTHESVMEVVKAYYEQQHSISNEPIRDNPYLGELGQSILGITKDRLTIALSDAYNQGANNALIQIKSDGSAQLAEKKTIEEIMAKITIIY